MPEPTIIQIDLNQRAQPISATEGTEIVLRGAFTSRHDGSVIDAVTTSWPADSAGGARVDPIGLFNLEAGGLRMTSRDIPKHEVHAMVMGKGGEACSAAGVASPCLVMNQSIAIKRLLSPGELVATLDGKMTVEVPPPLAPPVVPPSSVPYLQVGASLTVAALLGFGGWKWKKQKDASPEGQLLALSKKVKAQLEKADPVLAAPLAPTVDAAIRAIRDKRVDASSKEGKRVAEALRRVNDRIDAATREERAAKEQEAADELLREMESALEAAEELKRTHR